eukprot:m51a1_g10589 hypothetical protein (279) ;mRNA; r:4316-5221
MGAFWGRPRECHVLPGPCRVRVNAPDIARWRRAAPDLDASLFEVLVAAFATAYGAPQAIAPLVDDALASRADDRDKSDAAVRIRESIFQSIIMCGGPRVYAAMEQWYECVLRLPPSVYVPHSSRAADTPAAALWDAGVQRFGQVHGAGSEAHEAALSAPYDDLWKYVACEHYGRVLCDATLSSADRELALAAAAGAMGSHEEFWRHLEGARNVGASVRTIADTKQVVEAVYATLRAREAPLGDCLEPHGAATCAAAWVAVGAVGATAALVIAKNVSRH